MKAFSEYQLRRQGAKNDAEHLFHRENDRFLLADWKNLLFIHYEVDPRVLQAEVPFEIDVFEGSAFVSVVFFRMFRMRPNFGGKLSRMLLSPVASHEFLNVRTYVRHGGEAGIYFIREFLPNPLSLLVGPYLCGLPYKFGRFDCDFSTNQPRQAKIVGRNGSFQFESKPHPPGESFTCEPDSLDSFLIERYSAFTHRKGQNRFFRVWHPPWEIFPMETRVIETSLLEKTGKWFQNATLSHSNFAEGFEDVKMGWPRLITTGR
jgi:uncharacterized protein YqjF (DUF2071 family)